MRHSGQGLRQVRDGDGPIDHRPRARVKSAACEDDVMSCVFCSIIAGDAPAHVIYEDEQCVGILDINPATRGHCLVLPWEHVEDLWAIDASRFGEVARATHAVAALLHDNLAPDGLTIFQANRRAGWQDVFHLHVHLVPRYREDGLVRPWTMTTKELDLASVAERVRARADGEQ